VRHGLALRRVQTLEEIFGRQATAARPALGVGVFDGLARTGGIDQRRQRDERGHVPHMLRGWTDHTPVVEPVETHDVSEPLDLARLDQRVSTDSISGVSTGLISGVRISGG
jgi:hypothetical protein